MEKADGLKRGFSKLPPLAKGAIVVGGVIATYYLVRLVVKLPSMISRGSKDRKEDSAWNQEFDQLNQGDERATLTKAEFLAMASSIHRAMDGYGTDEETIYDAFRRIKNDTDFAGLMAAYGKRTISSGRGNIFQADFKGRLIPALRDELGTDYPYTEGLTAWLKGTDEAKKVNSILKKNGVTYRI